MNKNTKKVVYRILEEDEYSRSDDCYLILKVLQEMIPCNAGTAFGQVLQGMYYKGISFESITRHRRKFLEKHPELKPNEATKARVREEIEYHAEFGGKNGNDNASKNY